MGCPLTGMGRATVARSEFRSTLMDTCTITIIKIKCHLSPSDKSPANIEMRRKNIFDNLYLLTARSVRALVTVTPTMYVDAKLRSIMQLSWPLKMLNPPLNRIG
jgi:hypothetical protein